MFDISQKKTDKTKAKEGVWKTFEGASFLIASTDTPHYRRAVLKSSKKVSATKLRNDSETQHGMNLEVMAEVILLDWKDVVNEGEALDPTFANKLAVLEAYAPLREFIAVEAQSVENFTRGGEAVDAGDVKSGD